MPDENGHSWIRQGKNLMMIGGKSETIPFPRDVTVHNLLERMCEAARLSSDQGRKPKITRDEEDRIRDETQRALEKLGDSAIPDMIEFLAKPYEKNQYGARCLCKRVLVKHDEKVVEPILASLTKQSTEPCARVDVLLSIGPTAVDRIAALPMVSTDAPVTNRPTSAGAEKHDASMSTEKRDASTSTEKHDASTSTTEDTEFNYSVLLHLLRHSIKDGSPYSCVVDRFSWDLYSNVESKDEVYLPAKLLPVLNSKLNSKDQSELEGVVRGIGFIFPPDKTAIDKLIELSRNESVSQNARLQAIEGLGRIALRDSRSGKVKSPGNDEISLKLASNESRLSKETIYSIAHCLRELEDSKSDKLQQAALKSLCMVAIDYHEFCGDLLKAVRSDDEATSKIACEASRESGREESKLVVDELVKIIASSSPEKRSASIEKLKLFGKNYGDTLVPVFVKCLEGSAPIKSKKSARVTDAEVHADAARALIYLGADLKPFIPEIERISKSSVASSADNAAWVLQKYAGDDDD
jgi:hypothetical protein